MKKIGTTLFCAALAALTYAGGTAHSLSVGEGFVDPLGFHDSTPTFSWKLPVGVGAEKGAAPYEMTPFLPITRELKRPVQ